MVWCLFTLRDIKGLNFSWWVTESEFGGKQTKTSCQFSPDLRFRQQDLFLFPATCSSSDPVRPQHRWKRLFFPLISSPLWLCYIPEYSVSTDPQDISSLSPHIAHTRHQKHVCSLKSTLSDLLQIPLMVLSVVNCCIRIRAAAVSLGLTVSSARVTVPTQRMCSSFKPNTFMIRSRGWRWAAGSAPRWEDGCLGMNASTLGALG